MSYEVWVFSQSPEYKRSAGLVDIKIPPPDHSLGDVELLAWKYREAYAHEGLDVTTVVRNEAAY
jgi:hypothetical protein